MCVQDKKRKPEENVAPQAKKQKAEILATPQKSKAFEDKLEGSPVVQKPVATPLRRRCSQKTSPEAMASDFPQ